MAKDQSITGEKISKIIYLSNPALAALSGILGFLETTPAIMAASIGVTIASAVFDTISRANETNSSVVQDYYEAVAEAVKATGFTFRNRSSRLLLFEKLCAEEIPFDVEVTEALTAATSIREEYRDHPAVQEIINVFDANFKIAAAKRVSLSNFLVLYKTESIMELLQYAETVVNSKVINDIQVIKSDLEGLREQAADIQDIVEKAKDDGEFLRQVAETGQELIAKAANWANQSMIVYVLAIVTASVLSFGELSIDFSFFVLTFMSEMVVEYIARANQNDNPWTCMVVQAAILAVLYCVGQGMGFVSVMLRTAAVCIAVGGKYLLAWLASQDEKTHHDVKSSRAPQKQQKK